MAHSDPETFSLSDILGNRPAVLAWFPSAFRSPCDNEVVPPKDHSTEFEAPAATVLGGSADSGVSVNPCRNGDDLSFNRPSDMDRHVIDAYGLEIDIDEGRPHDVANHAVFVRTADSEATYTWTTDAPRNEPDDTELLDALETAACDGTSIRRPSEPKARYTGRPNGEVMSQQRDWRAGLDDIDAHLIDEYQSGFPITGRPFRVIGDELGITEQETLDRVRRLRDRGVFRRFGPVLNPPVIGSSTLAAVRAPEDRFDDIAAIINGYRQVNHNYRRDHVWNMWFVVTASSQETRDAILTEIEDRTGCAVLNLPMLTDYYIDLEFPVVNDDRFARESMTETEVSATRISEGAAANLSPLDRRLLVEIQDGFPLSATPYADVATAVGADVDDVLTAIHRLLDDGCIKRVGCVVNHVVTGFDANCMVVWDVPDDELDERGAAVGSLPYVTLCYHRPRRPEQDWPYNLFTMVHGRDPAAVDAVVDELATEYLPHDHERLYSTETLKQTGAQYEELVGE